MLYESLRVAAGVRETPKNRTLVPDLEGNPYDGYSITFYEKYRAPKTGNPYEDGNREKLIEEVGFWQFTSIGELFHEMAEAAGKVKEMSKELKVGDKVKVVDMAPAILESDRMRNPIGLTGTIESIDLDFEEAPYEVVFLTTEEPDGATDAVTVNAMYPELYHASELEKVEDE